MLTLPRARWTDKNLAFWMEKSLQACICGAGSFIFSDKVVDCPVQSERGDGNGEKLSSTLSRMGSWPVHWNSGFELVNHMTRFFPFQQWWWLQKVKVDDDDCLSQFGLLWQNSRARVGYQQEKLISYGSGGWGPRSGCQHGWFCRGPSSRSQTSHRFFMW